MFADHLHLRAKLFLTMSAEIAGAAVREIMHANAVAWAQCVHIAADGFDRARDVMAGSNRQVSDWRYPGPIMRVGMADPARRHPDENVCATDLRHWDFDFLQWLAKLDQANASHDLSLRKAGKQELIRRINLETRMEPAGIGAT
jgi:hypothetical protein